MPQNYWTICVICRKGWRGAPTCQHETRAMPRDFRLPRRRDNRAWQRLAEGNLNTEQSQVDRHYVEQELRVAKEHADWMGFFSWAPWALGDRRGFWLPRRKRAS